MKPGDLIEEVNGHPVATPHEVSVAIGGMKAGDIAAIKYARGSEQMSKSVTLAGMAGDKSSQTQIKESEPSRVGLSLMDIPEELRGQDGIPADGKGALVGRVLPGSPAEAAGILQGDVILGVGIRSLDDTASIVTAIRSVMNSGAVALRVLHGGRQSFVLLKTEARDATQG